MSIKSDFGERIKQLRISKNLSQDELAARLGYKSRSSINKIELGQNDIPTSKISQMARFFHVSEAYLMGWEEEPTRVPVLGTIRAGIPNSAIEDILDYEEITEDMARHGKHFALKIKGSSMSPKILEGDVVIFRECEDAENGDICAVLVNGDDATIKKIRKTDDGIYLIPFNMAEFEPMFYTNEEIEKKPVRIIGKAVEIRRTL